MNDQQLKELASQQEPDKIKSILGDFNAKNATNFDFSAYHVNDQWHTVWAAAFAVLNDASQTANSHVLCLNTIRLLTRDESSLLTHDIISDLNCLLRLAALQATKSTAANASKNLIADEGSASAVVAEDKHNADSSGGGGGVTKNTTTPTTTTTTKATLDATTMAVMVESLKCLCNLAYQSTDCRRECMRQHVIDTVFRRLTSDTAYPCAVELHDLKLLFLLTTLEPGARSRIQIDLNGLAYLTEWLDERVNEQPPYSDEQLELRCEVLKLLFTIASSPDKSPNESEIESLHLTGVVRELLLCFGGMKDERERAIVRNAVNLLTSMASASLTELMVRCEQQEGVPCGGGGAEEASMVEEEEGAVGSKETASCSSTRHFSPPPLVFEGYNVHVLDILLRYLRHVLNEQDERSSLTATNTSDHLAPALTALVKCAQCHRVMRRYLRRQLLPPLRNAMQRPEVGGELRNHLCRYLTLPAMMVRDLAAELLFICCKENVGRMIKYTGYGNAAGLFAKRGLLDCRRVESSAYSSDSDEDSDTEEYKRVAPHINPVLGCYEPPPQPLAGIGGPLAGMSEEQKEYEAMKLVNLMERLHRQGVVQPCRVGDDGKPVAVDHILQLQEELPQQQLEQKHKT